MKYNDYNFIIATRNYRRITQGSQFTAHTKQSPYKWVVSKRYLCNSCTSSYNEKMATSIVAEH